jgi:hypothetical protein
MPHPNDTACPHGYLYPSVGGQTPCHVPNCGQEDQPTRITAPAAQADEPQPPTA